MNHGIAVPIDPTRVSGKHFDGGRTGMGP